ncbi:MAG: hypothetical protein M3R48_09660 [Candidatus Dormibacteraeota bacterium]|nr:hypothetical protein [Candidatus Dormibacteraeota bacterium]
MNGYEITELGQVREQENMLERAEGQALRQARRDAPGTDGASMPPWLVTFLRQPRHSHPHPAHDAAGR